RAAADEPCLDDLRHRPGDRSDPRRLDARRRALAADLLVPGRVRPGAGGQRGPLAAGDASAGAAPAAEATTAGARLRGDRLQPPVPAPGCGRRAELRRTVPVHRIGAGLPDGPAAPG